MEFTQFSVATEKPEKFKGDLLVYCCAQSDKGFIEHKGTRGSFLQKAVGLGDFSGKRGEKIFYYPNVEHPKSESRASRIVFLGIGKVTKDTAGPRIRELLRKLGGEIAKAAETVKADRVMVVLPKFANTGTEQNAECICEGIALGDYRFEKYKNFDPEKKDYKGIKEVIVYAGTAATGARKGVKKGEIAGKATCLARDMANEPANEWTPEKFADVARRLSESYLLKCRVLEKRDMKRLRMGGIVAVNKGSVDPPKLVVLEYKGKKSKQTLLVVGKGITFDSGGINLKPSTGMENMKFDMCGGAAVLAFMQAIGEEKPDLNIIAMIPATDNMLGSSSVKPGDVITHYGGTTSEIVNTDAEGRMVLADALAYGIKKYKPDCAIDIATLTGAAIIGLGHHYTGLLSNNDQVVGNLIEAGEKSGEPLWRLPLGSEYAKQIESKIADIKNAGGRAGGTITAGCYLEKFVGDTCWAHLDIAGTAWDFTEKPYIPKGPSGVGVRTLLEFVRAWQDIKKA